MAEDPQSVAQTLRDLRALQQTLADGPPPAEEAESVVVLALALRECQPAQEPRDGSPDPGRAGRTDGPRRAQSDGAPGDCPEPARMVKPWLPLSAGWPCCRGWRGRSDASSRPEAQWTPNPADEPRYTIRRRAGRTLCDDCDYAHELQRGPAGYVLWLTAGAARLRTLTHCSQCGRALVPGED
jgi:hypothetical protein